MSGPYDTLVVGAGIVGASCAWELARAGQRVLVVDRGPIGGGATAAGMGHIVVLDDSEPQLALSGYSQQLWNELAGELPETVEFWNCGTIWVAADEQEMAEVRRKQALYRQMGLRVEILDERSLYEAEPKLRPGLAGGLLVGSDSVLYPPAAACEFLRRAKNQGAQVRLGVEVKQILTQGGVLTATGERISAGCVINAAGPWSGALGESIPVRPRKGHLVVTERYPGFVNHQLVELGYLKSAHKSTGDSVAFNVQPRRTGQALIGSSRQFDHDDSAIDHKLLAAMLARAFEYMPGLGKLKGLRTWTGLRPATPDKLPLIGPDTKHKRIWLATGHEGLGITTAPATGRLLAALMLGHEPAIAMEPYSPARLAPAGAVHV